MQYLTYKELALLCGKQKAYTALLVIEKSANIRNDNVVVFDCEKRLRSALDAMCENQEAA